MLAIGGTAGVILVLPLEATITEVNARTEPKSEAIPVSAIVVEAQQDAVAGAELSMVPTGQELTAVAMVVEPDIEADNGVIHGIDLCFFPRRRSGRSNRWPAIEDGLVTATGSGRSTSAAGNSRRRGAGGAPGRPSRV